MVETVDGAAELRGLGGLQADFYGVERVADAEFGDAGEDAGDETLVVFMSRRWTELRLLGLRSEFVIVLGDFGR